MKTVNKYVTATVVGKVLQIEAHHSKDVVFMKVKVGFDTLSISGKGEVLKDVDQGATYSFRMSVSVYKGGIGLWVKDYEKVN